MECAVNTTSYFEQPEETEYVGLTFRDEYPSIYELPKKYQKYFWKHRDECEGEVPAIGILEPEEAQKYIRRMRRSRRLRLALRVTGYILMGAFQVFLFIVQSILSIVLGVLGAVLRAR